MGFKFSEKFENLGLFNENFTGYGFEDYEFGYRYSLNGFILKQTYATIIHDEGNPNINNFIKKHYHLGRDGMKNLILVDRFAAKKTSYYKLENGIIFSTLLKLPGLKFLILFFEKILIKLDRLNFMKIYFLYNILRAISYSRGVIDRNKKNLKNNNWYE